MSWWKRSEKVPRIPVAEYWFYHMQQTQQPTSAGAMSYAFMPTRLLPVQNLVTGTAYRPANPLPGMPLVAQQAGLQYGLGGTIAGQFVLQPLQVRSNSQGVL